MLISIIIPTRNRYEYINLLIGDILQQDVFNYEIIVVDQSDEPQIISNCKHIITKTLGPCVSRNIGAKKASGEILVFLDDDARIYPDFIREITTPVIKERFDAVAGATCDTKGNYLHNDDEYLQGDGQNFINILTQNPDAPTSRITISFPGGCSAILKTVFEKIGGFDENFDPTGAGEDRDMALNLYKHGYATWYNSKAKLLHTIAPSGGTRGIGSRSLMLDVHSYKMCKKYFSKQLSENLKKTIIQKYKLNFYRAVLTLKLVRTKYLLLVQIKKKLS